MSDDKKADDVRSVWFQGETVAAIREQLNAAGPDAVLQFNAPFDERATVEVLRPGQDAVVRVKSLNEAHVCPPFCW